MSGYRGPLSLLLALALAGLRACKPRDPPIGDELEPLVLPGLSISVPPGKTEPPDRSWFVGQAFTKPKAGGYVQVSWRKVDGFGDSIDLTKALENAARTLDAELSDMGETTISGHRGMTARVKLTERLSGSLTTWHCPEDHRTIHALIIGPAQGIYDRILASATCHTWPAERRAGTADLPHFDPPAGFLSVEPEQEGTAKWTRDLESVVLGFGLPTRPSAALLATRERLPPALRDLEESLLVGPDQHPRARITGRLQDNQTVWRFTYDLLDCSDHGLVYLATHYAPVATPTDKAHPLDAVRCPLDEP